jgi:hypothetical protein
MVDSKLKTRLAGAEVAGKEDQHWGNAAAKLAGQGTSQEENKNWAMEVYIGPVRGERRCRRTMTYLSWIWIWKRQNSQQSI